jgi:hypothetical protein
MNQIEEAIKNIHEKKLDKMRENFNAALSQKAVKILEEKKAKIATDYIKTR